MTVDPEETPTWCYHSYFSWPHATGNACNLPHGHESPCVFMGPPWIQQALDAGHAIDSPGYYAFFRDADPLQPWDSPNTPCPPWTLEDWQRFDNENPKHRCPSRPDPENQAEGVPKDLGILQPPVASLDLSAPEVKKRA